MSNETNETPSQGRKVGIARFFELLGRDLWPLYKSGILCVLGFLPGTGHNTGKLSRFGYVTLTAQKDNLLCAAGEQLPAHEFHYYDTTCNGEDFLAQKADGRAWRCGIATENLYAGFPHFHFYAHPQMAARFLEMCRKGSPERPERI